MTRSRMVRPAVDAMPASFDSRGSGKRGWKIPRCIRHSAGTEKREQAFMSYAVKEIFYTLQGEGANTGRPAVFCRFAGCNLWSGREQDRADATCRFCDTDFVGTDGP